MDLGVSSNCISISGGGQWWMCDYQYIHYGRLVQGSWVTMGLQTKIHPPCIWPLSKPNITKSPGLLLPWIDSNKIIGLFIYFMYIPLFSLVKPKTVFISSIFSSQQSYEVDWPKVILLPWQRGDFKLVFSGLVQDFNSYTTLEDITHQRLKSGDSRLKGMGKS